MTGGLVLGTQYGSYFSQYQREKFPSRSEPFVPLSPTVAPTVAVTHEVSVKASLLLQTSKVTGSRQQFSDRIESKRGNQASHGTYV